jgi:hypothetical protein
VAQDIILPTYATGRGFPSGRDRGTAYLLQRFLGIVIVSPYLSKVEAAPAGPASSEWRSSLRWIHQKRGNLR